MSDGPVTQAAFEAFQVELFSQLTELDHRLQTLESTSWPRSSASKKG